MLSRSRRTWLSIFALSGLLTTSAQAGKLDGRRLADRILTASDAERGQLPPRAVEMAVRRHGMKRAALRSDFVNAHNTRYTKELPETPIRDQASSGRCWIFTALNMFERDAQLAGKKAQKLSRAYINARNLQVRAYDLLKNAVDASLVGGLGGLSISEGGSFDYAIHLVEQYGAVPEHVMRDFADSKASTVALKMLEHVVYDAQQKLRTLPKQSAKTAEVVKQAQADIDRVIARAFTGKDKLPDSFVVDGKTYTPKTYADEHLGLKTADYVSFTDDHDRRLGWYDIGAGLHKVRRYNTRNVEAMKQLVKNAIDQGKKVYVSAPVGEAGAEYMVGKPLREGSPVAAPGVMSIAAFDYARLGVPLPTYDRGYARKAGLNNTNHAMTIVGYDLGPDGKIVKWKVENSWGEKAADGGFQHMYDDFFTSFVGAVTVPRSALPKTFVERIVADRDSMKDIDWTPK